MTTCGICQRDYPAKDEQGRDNYHHGQEGALGEVCRHCVQRLVNRCPACMEGSAAPCAKCHGAGNMRLVFKEVSRLWATTWGPRRYNNDREQAESDGWYALLKAAWHYKPSRGWKFSTYAVNVIKCDLTRDRRTLNEKFVDAVERHEEFDPPGRDEEDGAEVVERHRQVEQLLARLDGKTQRIMRLRFQDGLKLKDVGAELGVSKERIRQIQVAALEVMRGPWLFEAMA